MATIQQIAKVKRDAPNANTLLTDVQIGEIIDEVGGIHERAVAHVYDLLAASTASKGEMRIGKYYESFAQQGRAYERLATLWRKRIIVKKPYVGGISKSDIENKKADTDTVFPIFKKGIDNAD